MKIHDDSNSVSTLLKWRFTFSEMVAFAFVVISITLWSLATFQSKSDAAIVSSSHERDFEKLEKRIDGLSQTLNAIGNDVSYIRGRLEPKK